MRVRFLETASRELDDAVDYYELEFEGLGKRFKEEVRRAVQRISRHPLAWTIEIEDIRKCLLHKFPYKLLYSVESDHMLIIAVAHQPREPDYWSGRV